MENLPNEILRDIVDYIRPCGFNLIDDISVNEILREALPKETDLRHFSMVSKQFYALIEPLTRSFIWEIGGRETTIHPTAHPMKYSRTKRVELVPHLVKHPEKAAKVRVLSLSAPDTEHNFKRNDPVRLAWLSCASKFDRRGSWIEDLKRGWKDADAALLLQMLPNLEILRLEVYCSLSLEFKHTLDLLQELGTSRTCSKTLSKLRCITIEHHDLCRCGGFYPWKIPDVPFHPVLQEFRLRGVLSRLGPQIRWRQATSNVRTVQLCYSVVDGEFLIGVLKCCRSLTTFDYYCAMDHHSNEEIHTFGTLSTAALIRILEQRRDTLQIIRLGSDFYRKESLVDDPSNGFENFEVLRSLQIFASVLVGEEQDGDWLTTSDDADAESASPDGLQHPRSLDQETLSRIQRIAHSLPPSLQTLHIPCNECRETEMQWLVEEIVKGQSTRLPNLRLLDLSESDALWSDVGLLKEFETNDFKVRLLDIDRPVLGFMDRDVRQKIINIERESRGLLPKDYPLPQYDDFNVFTEI